MEYLTNKEALGLLHGTTMIIMVVIIIIVVVIVMVIIIIITCRQIILKDTIFP